MADQEESSRVSSRQPSRRSNHQPGAKSSKATPDRFDCDPHCQFATIAEDPTLIVRKQSSF
ncbi:hypothetical protein K0M31_002199 [Melipona bicolor]|uniref:Uncharacterized protein n=1 Tax=Melipona bicolor TaxID=60889 RepID=A0AA40KYM8_9HYME|nr:hypothetical protein K0M31_002199 [Melipona bicolor]